MAELDINRCAVCGWPLVTTVDKGCIRRNCCQRPLPSNPYDAERAVAEGYSRYTSLVGKPIPESLAARVEALEKALRDAPEETESLYLAGNFMSRYHDWREAARKLLETR